MRLSFLFLLAATAAPLAAQSDAFVEQAGSDNVVELAQFSNALVTDARVIQVGTGHVARVDQQRGGLVDVEQRRRRQRAWRAGDGFGDASSTALVADGSTLMLRQDGTSNRAFVEQLDGGFAEIITGLTTSGCRPTRPGVLHRPVPPARR